MATATRRKQIYSWRVVEHAPGREVGVAAWLAGSTLIVESSSANALAIAIRKTPSVVVATTGLLDLLEPQRVEAVVAHELSTSLTTTVRS
jgi:Zn-dependent protease with chaperone function